MSPRAVLPVSLESASSFLHRCSSSRYPCIVPSTDAQIFWFLGLLTLPLPFSSRPSRDSFVISLLEVQGGTGHGRTGVV